MDEQCEVKFLRFSFFVSRSTVLEDHRRGPANASSIAWTIEKGLYRENSSPPGPLCRFTARSLKINPTLVLVPQPSKYVVLNVLMSLGARVETGDEFIFPRSPHRHHHRLATISSCWVVQRLLGSGHPVSKSSSPTPVIPPCMSQTMPNTSRSPNTSTQRRPIRECLRSRWNGSGLNRGLPSNVV